MNINLPKDLYVIFSSQITQGIETIDAYNTNYKEGVNQWYNYIDDIHNYLSNPSIAFDYANRFPKFPNGAKFIGDFDYNVGYSVKRNRFTKNN